MATDTEALERGRITARVPKNVRERLEEAAGLSGATINQFVVQAAVDRADEILERERVTRLTARDAEWLLNILDKPPQPPTGRLQRALKHYQKATRGDSNRAFDWRARSGKV